MGPHERRAHLGGGAAPLPFADGDAAGSGEAPRVVARRRAVRRPLRASRRVPAVPQRVRARGRVVPEVPPRRGARARLGAIHLLLLRVPGLTVEGASVDTAPVAVEPRARHSWLPLAADPASSPWSRSCS